MTMFPVDGSVRMMFLLGGQGLILTATLMSAFLIMFL